MFFAVVVCVCGVVCVGIVYVFVGVVCVWMVVVVCVCVGIVCVWCILCIGVCIQYDPNKGTPIFKML